MKKICVFLTLFVLILAGCAQSSEKNVTLSTGELAEIIKQSVEFPALLEHTDKDDIKIFLPNIIFDDIAELTVFQQAMTVHLVEIIVIKPAEGRADAVMEFLRGRQDTLTEQLAFYPMQAEAAENMVVGSKHNIAYLICHKDAPTAEEALLKKIDESVK